MLLLPVWLALFSSKKLWTRLMALALGAPPVFFLSMGGAALVGSASFGVVTFSDGAGVGKLPRTTTKDAVGTVKSSRIRAENFKRPDRGVDGSPRSRDPHFLATTIFCYDVACAILACRVAILGDMSCRQSDPPGQRRVARLDSAGRHCGAVQHLLPGQSPEAGAGAAAGTGAMGGRFMRA